jgi:ATP-dependent RNA helicase DHX29
MAKKKKTQLKPVARGFATTSVPKKVLPAELNEQMEVGVDVAETPGVENGTTPVVPSPEHPVPHAGDDEFDLDKVEEQSLQNLVDRLQEKTEKEIVRAVKVCYLVKGQF